MANFFRPQKDKNKAFAEKVQRPSRFGGFWAWLAIFLGLVALFFILRSFLIEWEKRKAIDREVMALQEEIEKIKKENSNMQDSLRYLETDTFQERELKDKLNLIKEGEQMVYVKEEEIAEKKDNSESSISQSADQQTEVSVKKPNYYYWWEFIFGKR